ncbi:unnamed protein product [Pleuronectes platessa]|uniref:Uncharacterized protein n=1 Tax=Pleuronectes platessa TaxID=8262 RepID=A0A9N7VMF1_PLEPL|nr:unnamed protein product [Pleuronectes platessa]
MWRQTDAQQPAKVFEHKQRINRALGMEVTHAHLLAFSHCIISTRGPWGLTDPPPSSVPPSQSHAIRTAHSGPGPQLTFSAVCHDVARGADKPCFSSPPSPQKGGGGAASLNNRCCLSYGDRKAERSSGVEAGRDGGHLSSLFHFHLLARTRPYYLEMQTAAVFSLPINHVMYQQLHRPPALCTLRVGKMSLSAQSQVAVMCANEVRPRKPLGELQVVLTSSPFKRSEVQGNALSSVMPQSAGICVCVGQDPAVLQNLNPSSLATLCQNLHSSRVVGCPALCLGLCSIRLRCLLSSDECEEIQMAGPPSHPSNISTGHGTLELKLGLHQLMTDYSSVGPWEQAGRRRGDSAPSLFCSAAAFALFASSPDCRAGSK